MILCTHVKELQELSRTAKKAGKSIGLVPTMGALHEGHVSLIKASHAENDLTIVSIFVNPTQFGPNEDYEKYPRSLEKDCQAAQNAGADIVFSPAPSELYPHKDMTWVEVTGSIVTVLCGRTRPIHFRGVATIITKLFHIAMPDKAYFGQKDAQQAQVIKRMIDDLFFPVELRIMPIIRENDGLAKSSRNIYLSSEERNAALVLYRSLTQAKGLFAKGQHDPQILCSMVRDIISAEPLSSIDYIEIYSLPGLLPISGKITQDSLLAVAVKFGATRLIDNVVLEVSRNGL